ncbi:hypothetical protein FQZ97_853830 [compost metagenome]
MATVAAATAGIIGNIAAIGMAHDGIDSVPQTGTWLLEKGERVTTAETSAKLDRTLADIQTGQRRGGSDRPVSITINQPGITNAREAQQSSAQTKKTIARALEEGRRYL